MIWHGHGSAHERQLDTWQWLLICARGCAFHSHRGRRQAVASLALGCCISSDDCGDARGHALVATVHVDPLGLPQDQCVWARSIRQRSHDIGPTLERYAPVSCTVVRTHAGYDGTVAAQCATGGGPNWRLRIYGPAPEQLIRPGRRTAILGQPRFSEAGQEEYLCVQLGSEKLYTNYCTVEYKEYAGFAIAAVACGAAWN